MKGERRPTKVATHYADTRYVDIRYAERTANFVHNTKFAGKTGRPVQGTPRIVPDALIGQKTVRARQRKRAQRDRTTLDSLVRELIKPESYQGSEDSLPRQERLLAEFQKATRLFEHVNKILPDNAGVKEIKKLLPIAAAAVFDHCASQVTDALLLNIKYNERLSIGESQRISNTLGNIETICGHIIEPKKIEATPEEIEAAVLQVVNAASETEPALETASHDTEKLTPKQIEHAEKTARDEQRAEKARSVMLHVWAAGEILVLRQAATFAALALDAKAEAYGEIGEEPTEIERDYAQAQEGHTKAGADSSPSKANWDSHKLKVKAARVIEAAKRFLIVMDGKQKGTPFDILQRQAVAFLEYDKALKEAEISGVTHAEMAKRSSDIVGAGRKAPLLLRAVAKCDRRRLAGRAVSHTRTTIERFMAHTAPQSARAVPRPRSRRGFTTRPPRRMADLG
jgi:hypothetical protein